MAFQRDYQFGKHQEVVLLPRLNEFFKDEITPTTDKFHKYDFEGKDCVYEMKSRTCCFETYPTTLLPADKVIAREGSGTLKQIFLFNFTNGLYYIEYNEEAWKDIEIASFRRFRIGVNDKEKPYYHIPTTLLKRIF
jgi:hypothetical protein